VFFHPSIPPTMSSYLHPNPCAFHRVLLSRAVRRLTLTPYSHPKPNPCTLHRVLPSRGVRRRTLRPTLHLPLPLLLSPSASLVAIHVDAYKASIAIRIMSDTRDEEQEQRWRERQDRGVLQDTQDLTVTYIIPVIYLIV
jgi:hypothetical protein